MCGVIGVIGPKRVSGPLNAETRQQSAWSAYKVYRGLLTLQHRGQDAAGILSFDRDQQKFHCEKDLGLVDQVFNQNKIEELTGNVAIGHTRYATIGGDGRKDLQPMVTGFPFGVGFVHNGNIVNYYELSQKFIQNSHHKFLTRNDLELFLNYFCEYFSLQGSQGPMGINEFFNLGQKAAEKIFHDFKGAYALLGVVADFGLMAMRDPHGIRPLVLGRKESSFKNEKEEVLYSYCICSETKTLNFLGYEYMRDIRPGEFLLITHDGELLSWNVNQESHESSPCMFEWVYFSGAESSIEGKSVYRSRLNLGRALGRKINDLIEANQIEQGVVCPVPDTSRTASIALAEETGLPYREALIKNRYVQRSFILNTQEKREKAVELKLAPVPSEIEGQHIILVDDSIVRGTTSKKIIALLKDYGAREITLAITCPPIRYGCYYGIDFPSEEELLAPNKTVEEIANWIGAKRVIYLDQEDVCEAIGLSKMCFACINNEYPSSVDSKQEFCARRRLTGEEK